MRYYVKVEDGDVVDGPRQISSNESDSPNENWGKDQMGKHGYFEVNLDHDERTEKIDYDNPTVAEDGVEYPCIPLLDAEKVAYDNSWAEAKRLAEYPTDQEKVEAFWQHVAYSNNKLVADIILRIEAVNQKYPLK